MLTVETWNLVTVWPTQLFSMDNYDKLINSHPQQYLSDSILPTRTYASRNVLKFGISASSTWAEIFREKVEERSSVIHIQ